MIKFLSRFLIAFLITFVLLIGYLSYFGISTDKFDNLIKSKANEVNRYVKLDFKKTKIHLNLRELNIVVKLQNPQIIVNGNNILLSKLDLFLHLKSFFTSDFLLKRGEVAFAKNDIKDLTKITSIYVPKIINNRLNKVFSKGSLEGELLVPFEPDGSIAKNYSFNGKIVNASINLTKELKIKDLTTEINHTKESGVKIKIKKGLVYDLDLAKSTLNFQQKKDKYRVESLLHTKGEFNFNQIKKLSLLTGLNLNYFKDVNGKADIKTKIDFDLSKRFKIQNLMYLTEGDINYFEIQTEEKKIIKKYLPEYNSKIVIKDSKIKLSNSKSLQNLELNGLIKIKNDFNSMKIKESYNYDNKIFSISGDIDLTNVRVEVSRINFIKKATEKGRVNFNINFLLNKYFNINKFEFLNKKNKIYLSNIKLNNNLEVENFESLEVKTFKNEKKNNDFLIKKSKLISISGDLFDAQPLLKSLFKKSEKQTFSKNFNSEIKINFKKAITGTNDDVFNFAMIANINKGSYNKLNLKGNFSKDEIIEMSIYEINESQKTLQVISDRARPFMKNFDFIKGFEGGKLEYESIISKKVSKSNLLITDFKVSKVPALAQLLTLASLQGIADTLSGEGIRFESFEMKSNSKGDVLNIEDALAMGPAVSILLEGYVDKGKTVSLRGTLVPATKLNAIIASIPLVGDILVGKKTGEGVVGVSFKMKGPPKDIKTTVNPIKTLTPRFIVRAVEKMKKKKQEESK
tara:strand:+ start:817 stop:3045 length:2229 start_codon:yes stop_codon:yes gene_type:complete